MVSVRAAKSKGASFEYDVLHNIKKLYPNMYLTSKQGFQQQYDLRDDVDLTVVECKFHKSISWNQAKKWYDKLENHRPTPEYKCLLVYKSNQQPPLMMFKIGEQYFCTEFSTVYGWEKHLSTRSKK